MTAIGRDTGGTRGWRERLIRFYDSDICYSFRRSPLVLIAALVCLLMVIAAVFAPLLAPTDPYDLRTLSLLDSLLPPVWVEGSDPRFLLGTDSQGGGILSLIMYGARVSLTVGVLAVSVSISVGITLGLLSGYIGGKIDAIIMRIADIQLTFPSLLMALLIGGNAGSVARAICDSGGHPSPRHFPLAAFCPARTRWHDR